MKYVTCFIVTSLFFFSTVVLADEGRELTEQKLCFKKGLRKGQCPVVKACENLGDIVFRGRCYAEEPKVWRECRTNSDCVQAEGVCQDVSLNKIYLKEAGEIYARKRTAADCAVNPDVRRPMSVVCQNQVCTIQSK